LTVFWLTDLAGIGPDKEDFIKSGTQYKHYFAFLFCVAPAGFAGRLVQQFPCQPDFGTGLAARLALFLTLK
jgi:hypothetical protein